MDRDHQTIQNATAGQTTVWLVLATDQSARVIVAFWDRTDASAHAEMLGSANRGESAVLREVVVQGGRRRCRLCGEPVVLDDSSDPTSWIHAADANDLGDHTAEV